MAGTLYDVEEVRTSRQGVTHLVLSNMHSDVNEWATWSLTYNRGGDLPLCSQKGDHMAPLPGARMCSVCEGLIEALEHDIGRARRLKAEYLVRNSAEYEAEVERQLANVGW